MANRPRVQRRNNAIAKVAGGVALILAVSALITVLFIKPWSTKLPTKSASSVSTTTITTPFTSVPETTVEPTTAITEETTTSVPSTAESLVTPTVPPPAVTVTREPLVLKYEEGKRCPGTPQYVDPDTKRTGLSFDTKSNPIALVVEPGAQIPNYFNNILIHYGPGGPNDDIFSGTLTGVTAGMVVSETRIPMPSNGSELPYNIVFCTG